MILRKTYKVQADDFDLLSTACPPTDHRSPKGSVQLSLFGDREVRWDSGPCSYKLIIPQAGTGPLVMDYL